MKSMAMFIYNIEINKERKNATEAEETEIQTQTIRNTTAENILKRIEKQELKQKQRKKNL